MSQAKTAIVIVNYRVPWHLKKCLESVLANTHDFHVILVQNSPDKDSLEVGEYFKARYPDYFTILVSQKNLGFVGGVNAVYSEVMKYKYFCLLNPDTIVTPGWLSEMVGVLDNDEDVAQVSPDSNSFYQDRTAWRFAKLLPGKFKEIYNYRYRFSPPRSEHPDVGFAPVKNFFLFPGGFCNVTRSKYFEKLGYINDPNIVHGYWDDFDLSYFVRQFGKVGATNKAYVYHYVNVSFDKIDENKKGMKQKLMLLNGLYVMDKWRDRLEAEIKEMDRDLLLQSASSSYVTQMVMTYFGLTKADPSIVEYIHSFPAKEIGELFLK